MLPTHGRYDYSSITTRPDYAWPGGRRLALQHILEHRDRVWLTRPRDISAHVESLPAGIVPGSR